ncbi:MAG: phosphotransferase, partial [Haloplanus sp.]
DTSRTLVHGDYSPKNVLVDRSDDPVPWILDFEVAHWGDPAFDAAFMLNHLFIKSIYNHDRHAAYADAADRFWTAYDRAAEWDIERETVAELAVLMLARVDGKSPVEYVDRAVAEALRRVAKRTLRGDAETLADFAALAREEAGAL